MGGPRTILGLGGSDHDVNACLIRGGDIVAAIEEERLTRRKYGLGGNLLDARARLYCLEAAGLDLDEVGAVAADSILAPPALLGCRSRARPLDHHLLHAAAAFYTAPFERAAILVVDNAGDLIAGTGEPQVQATSWYLGEGRRIDLVGRVGSTNFVEGPSVAGRPYQRGDGDHSLGHFYKRVTGHLGFRFPGGVRLSDFYFPEDGITMGLASYGDARFVDALWRLVELRPDGGYRLVVSDGRLDALLAGWLGTEAPFETRAAVAFAAQEVLVRLLCHLVDHVIRVTGERRLCLSGGVAMNSAANGEILRRTAVERLHVPPAPGDNGTGLGAALLVAAGQDEPMPRFTVYGGRPYAEAEIDAAMDAARGEGCRVRRLGDGADVELSQRLVDGQIVAWFEGGSENGRRALGHRSLIADPRRAATRDFINAEVKQRQFFRPFAPVVPQERADAYFAIGQPSPFMQIVAPVREEQRSALGAVTHVDGSARLQTVTADGHARWHRLLGAFERVAGVPVLLNTSLNGRGEPIVETPDEAVAAFLRLGVDALVIEDRLVERPR